MFGHYGFNPVIAGTNYLNHCLDAAKNKAYMLLDNGLSVVVFSLSVIDTLMRGHESQNPHHMKAINTRDVTHVHNLGKHEFCEDCYVEGFRQKFMAE